MNSTEQAFLCVLDKLKYEREFARDFEYLEKENDIMVRQKTRSILIKQTVYESWYSDCGVRDFDQLKDTLEIFKQKGLIKKFKSCPKIDAPAAGVVNEFEFSALAEPVLHIEFPEDFETRYENYKGPVIKTDSEKDNAYRFPVSLPAGTTFNNITIKFIDPEKVLISVRGIKHEITFTDMGFENTKTKKPNIQWNLLKILADYGGEITINDPVANEKIKKQKSILGQKLQSYFSLDYDPFYPYNDSIEKRGNSYKIKALLIPPIANKSKQKTDQSIEEQIESLIKEETSENRISKKIIRA